MTPDLLSERLREVEVAPATAAPAGNGSLRGAVEGFEAQFLREALAARRGNQTRTAAELGLSRRALIDKIP